jgi:hypothetical protein
MRHAVFSACLLSLAGCAATTAASSGGPPPAAVLTAENSRSGTVRTRANVAPVEHVEFPMQQVWDALPAIYTELGIPEVGQDPATRTVGNGSFIVTRTLAGEPLSRFLLCGTTAFGAPLADEARVQIDVRTTVSAEGAESSVRTTLVATARANRGTSADTVPCNSTGRLEARIATLVRQKLAS